uniref:Uncharacterized protein n=1 Tax=Anopheles atroparvus TaxID=41427 RepID=A0A182IS18_ANOAO
MYMSLSEPTVCLVQCPSVLGRIVHNVAQRVTLKWRSAVGSTSQHGCPVSVSGPRSQPHEEDIACPPLFADEDACWRFMVRSSYLVPLCDAIGRLSVLLGELGELSLLRDAIVFVTKSCSFQPCFLYTSRRSWCCHMVNSSWLANLSTRGVYLSFWRDMFISRSTPPASSSERANSAFFLITSFRVASTAAIVSSDVPWSHCGLPDGSFCTRSRIAYLPISSLFLWSIARLRRAVATAHTTRSTSMRSSSTRIGRPFSLRTVARISMLGCQ